MNAAEVSEQVASKELRLLVDNTLLVPEGETKGRTYKGSPMLRAIYMRNYEQRTSADPFTQGALPFPANGIAV